MPSAESARTKGFCRKSAFLDVRVTAAERVNAPFCIDEFLLACVERMAL